MLGLLLGIVVCLKIFVCPAVGEMSEADQKKLCEEYVSEEGLQFTRLDPRNKCIVSCIYKNTPESKLYALNGADCAPAKNRRRRQTNDTTPDPNGSGSDPSGADSKKETNGGGGGSDNTSGGGSDNTSGGGGSDNTGGGAVPSNMCYNNVCRKTNKKGDQLCKDIGYQYPMEVANNNCQVMCVGDGKPNKVMALKDSPNCLISRRYPGKCNNGRCVRA